MPSTCQRCTWAKDPLEIAYHDSEWGKPVHDDKRLFEKLTLEGAQAGLSWLTILKKRQGYRDSFSDFDPQIVARFTDAKVEKLLVNPAIIRHRLKIQSTINNARQVLKIQDEFGSFDHYLWQYVEHKPIVNQWALHTDLPSQTPLSKTISKDMLKRGFKFIGPTTCYALMQGVGMVNDHQITCFRYAELS